MHARIVLFQNFFGEFQKKAMMKIFLLISEVVASFN